MPLDSSFDEIRCRIDNPKNSEILLEKITVAGKPGHVLEVPLDTKGILPGSYRMTIEGMKSGSSVNSFVMDFTRPEDPEWLHSTAGKELKLPLPWTPVRAIKDRVDVWGRSFSWKNTLFPSSITSQGVEILTSPITLDAKSSGKN